MTEAVLTVEGLAKNYGGLAVTRNVDLTLSRGARHALIGPNGAGKTTLVGLLSGTVRPHAGTIRLMGDDVTRTSPAERVKRGLVRTFQINCLFMHLTVFQNVFLAASEHLGTSCRMLRSAFRDSAAGEHTWRVIDLLGLRSDAGRVVGQLPYGRQRLIEIAIALALRPKVLLLDEPAAGIPSSEVPLLLNAIDKLDDDVAILMVEHDMQIVRRFARSVTVLAEGAVIESGPPDRVMASAAVRAVYLGTSGQTRFGS